MTAIGTIFIAFTVGFVIGGVVGVGAMGLCIAAGRRRRAGTQKEIFPESRGKEFHSSRSRFVHKP